MSERARFAMYLVFLLGFLISAPVVVLYTAGYRLNVSTGKVTQTGILSLDTVPKGAAIYLDGKLLKNKTPAVLKNLLPGEHTVRFEKTGFSSWQKNLSVESRSTTFATSVALFLDRTANLLVADALQDASVHTDSGQAAYVIRQGDWAEIWSYRDSDASRTLLARYPVSQTAELNLLWSQDGSYLAIRTGSGAATQWSIVQTATGTMTAVSERVAGMQNGWWDASQDARFFARTATAVWRVDLPRAEAVALSTNAGAVASAGGNYVVAADAQDRTAVAWLEGDVSYLLAYLPLGDYMFQPAPNDLLLLQEPQKRRFILLDTHGGNEPILLNAEAVFWQWEPDGRRLLYSDGFDLHIYDAVMHTDETITRVSALLTGIAWYPAGSAVLYSQEDGVFAIELDYRDGRNVTRLAEGTSMGNLWVDATSRNAYFFGIIENKIGLWQRPLQR